jgi:hypothetical protein
MPTTTPTLTSIARSFCRPQQGVAGSVMRLYSRLQAPALCVGAGSPAPHLSLLGLTQLYTSVYNRWDGGGDVWGWGWRRR